MADMVVDMPIELQERLREEAAHRNLSVDTLLQKLVEANLPLSAASLLEMNRNLYATTTPEERVAAFRRWSEQGLPGPVLSDEALRRENMYE